MKAERISTDDIRNIGQGGSLTVTLPHWAAVESAKALVSRTKKRWPRPDGWTYTTKVDVPTFTITISCVVRGDENKPGPMPQKAE